VSSIVIQKKFNVWSILPDLWIGSVMRTQSTKKDKKSLVIQQQRQVIKGEHTRGRMTSSSKGDRFVPTADLCDEEEKLGAVHLRTEKLRDFGGKSRFFGRAATVRCFEDNGMVSKVLDEPGQGRVLVVDGAGSCARALFGDQMAEKVSECFCNRLSTMRTLALAERGKDMSRARYRCIINPQLPSA